ncbi:MAG: CPBP family intramembrane metalloprotease [Gemmatimonadetes bacterium]|nr:CPBP family intramembrane metalloprotease [Gemmatimonadota bacterium]MBI2403706.1 CPBP family intramembrane metalloprotease [Gemmatimonadota bacterium]MBI2537229.1 CPBP family intramembrane metalloprotease [Gemmatimonadota bacterium]MBI2616333.1 CPBP family intramembrane metalloprotease [Gemmatimonadota bacterium]
MTGVPLTLRRSRYGADLVVLAAVAVLLAFYYVGRADMIGVSSATRGWVAMTLRAVPGWAHFAGAALLLGVLPVMAARALTGLSLRELGLGLGNVRAGLLLLAGGTPLAILAGAIGASSPAMRAVYPLFPGAASGGFAGYAVMQFLYFGAWEVLFRGVLLFGLRPTVGGTTANVLQTALSVTAHFGRAINETASALPAGLMFGWADLRLGSIWYVAILHWIVGVSMDWCILH